MKKIIFVLLCLFVCLYASAQKDYVCFYSIHTGIDQSLKEHERQKELHMSQNKETLMSNLNENEVSKLKESYSKTQKRLQSLGLVIDTYFLTAESSRIIKRTIENQSRLIYELEKNPVWAVFALQEELNFVDKTRLLSKYITGLVLTGKSLFQLDNADRKIITDFILNELRTIENISRNAYLAVIFGKQSVRLQKIKWTNWATKEVDLVKEIINKAHQL
ncbi:MAG: hypothetical protein Q4G63_04395 [Bacteroidia bacterium]|nr:hypothetical protein [Bacteroidia bacterium]